MKFLKNHKLNLNFMFNWFKNRKRDGLSCIARSILDDLKPEFADKWIFHGNTLARRSDKGYTLFVGRLGYRYILRDAPDVLTENESFLITDALYRIRDIQFENRRYKEKIKQQEFLKKAFPACF